MSADAWLDKVGKGMQEAIRLEVARLRREGLPLVISRNGKVVILHPRKRRRRMAARSTPGTKKAARRAKPAKKAAGRRR